jgi:hypothetical protein
MYHVVCQKKIHSLLYRLKINHVMEKRNISFLGSVDCTVANNYLQLGFKPMLDIGLVPTIPYVTITQLRIS